MGVMFTGGPDRIYDKAAAEKPLPPKRPLGFCPPGLSNIVKAAADQEQREEKRRAEESDPLLWEGDNA